LKSLREIASNLALRIASLIFLFRLPLPNKPVTRPPIPPITPPIKVPAPGNIEPIDAPKAAPEEAVLSVLA
jgi:hypothetical protein